jgi:hypothetical protein
MVSLSRIAAIRRRRTTMAISGVSSATPTSFQNPNDPRQQFAQLAKAISSGDLTGAQQAFAQLSQTLGNNSNGSSTAGNSNDPFSQALSSIGQALQSGDINGAQQALASLQQQAQGARGHHHHGHHGGGQSGDANASSTAPSSGTAGPTGSTLDVTA